METPTIHRGEITYVNYEKQFASIEYMSGTKKKGVNCKTDSVSNGRKSHYFRVGDVVDFELKLSDRGDKMTAFNVKFLYNTPLEKLVNRAVIENRFSGYLKIVENKYFVKEWESYIFFPLQISPWEKPPVETADNEAINFKLINLDKPSTLAAELFSHNFIPEYRKALQHFTNEIDTTATISRITPHAVYVNLFTENIQAKLQIPAEDIPLLKIGDEIPVNIVHLTLHRIVVEKIR